MHPTLSIKRGETIRLPAVYSTDEEETPVDLTGYTLASTIRDRATRVAVATVAVTVDPDQVANTGVFTLYVSAATTASFEVGAPLALDVKITAPGGDITKTETVALVVEEDMTL